MRACGKGLIQPMMKTLQLLFILYPLQYFFALFTLLFYFSNSVTLLYFCFSPIQVKAAIVKIKLEFVSFKYNSKKELENFLIFLSV